MTFHVEADDDDSTANGTLPGVCEKSATSDDEKKRVSFAIEIPPWVVLVPFDVTGMTHL